jgi:hypothetical protein
MGTSRLVQRERSIEPHHGLTGLARFWPATIDAGKRRPPMRRPTIQGIRAFIEV